MSQLDDLLAQHQFSVGRLEPGGEVRYQRVCSCGWHGSQYVSEFMASCTDDGQRLHEIDFLQAALSTQQKDAP